MNLVLIGFMGSGKSEVGRKLAEALSRELVDTDAMVEARAGASISAVFERQGESVFRALEREAVSEAAAGEGRVISCGGGAVLDSRNVDALRASGVLFYLEMGEEDAERRTAGGDSRPLLNVGDRAGEIRRLLDERRPLYEAAAHHTINVGGKTLEEVVQEILEIWRR